MPFLLQIIEMTWLQIGPWLNELASEGQLRVSANQLHGAMLILTAALFALNALAAWIAGKFGASGRFHDRLVPIGYQIAPVAMVSLLLGLGIELFAFLPPSMAGAIKVACLALAVGWSVWLGWRILRSLQLDGLRCAIALLPGLVASFAIAAAWWPAIVGG